MEKNDWIEVLNILSERDYVDWIIIVVSIVSPLLLLISVLYSARAANAAKKATELNLEMFRTQQDEREKSFLPIFTISRFHNAGNYISLDLTNINEKKIYITNRGTELSEKDFLYSKLEKFESYTAYDDYGKKDYFKLWLYYTTLNHKSYCSYLIFRIIDNDLVIQSHEISNRDIQVVDRKGYTNVPEKNKKSKG